VEPVRTRRIIAALVVAGALLAGCGTGPDRVDSAAVVGETSIPLDDAQAAISSVLTRPGLVEGLTSQGGSQADIGRAVVSQLVIRDLLARLPAEQTGSVTEQQVQEQIDRAGGEQAVVAGSLSVGGPQASARDDLQLAGLARSELDRLSVTADIAVAQTREEAEQLAREIAAGGARADTALAGAGTAQRDLAIRPAETPQAALTPLIGLPAGRVAAFPLGTGQGWVVVRVTDRRLGEPVPGASATAGLDQQTLAEAGVRLLTPTALSAGVELNPRYGVWDPVRMVAAPTAADASLVLPVAGATPAPAATP
jgi:hypothetical protein